MPSTQGSVSPPQDAIPSSSLLLEKGTVLFAILVMFLHAYASVFPSAMNWGFHHLAFLPSYSGVILTSLVILSLLPEIQNRVVEAICQMSQNVEMLARRQKVILFAVGVASFSIVAWLLKVPTFLLGDGNLLLNNLSTFTSLEQVPNAFKHEPLYGFIIWTADKAMKMMGASFAELYAFQIVSVASGCVFVVLLFQFAALISSDPGEKMLLFLFSLFSGGSQLFLGYVENYAGSYVALLLFTVASIRSIRYQTSVAIPSFLFGILLTLHLGMISLLPALGYLLLRVAYRRQWADLSFGVLILFATLVFSLWLSRYPFHMLKQILIDGPGHTLPLSLQNPESNAYSLFSIAHFVDLANLLFLNHPFAFPLIVIAFWVSRWDKSSTSEEWLFIILVVISACGFMFLSKSDLGMSRDWDLYAPFALTITLAATVGWKYVSAALSKPKRLRLLLIVIVTTFAHLVAWVSVNRNENASVLRFSMLQDKRLWSTKALGYASETFATYFWDNNDIQQSVEYLERYLSLDSSNSRIWNNAANGYLAIGDQKRAIMYYEKARELGNRDEQIFINLGKLYAFEESFNKALDVMTEGLQSYPGSAPLCNNLGTLLLDNAKEYKEALRYFVKAIKLDSTLVQAYYGAALCSKQLHEEKTAANYFEKFQTLTSEPGKKSDFLHGVTR